MRRHLLLVSAVALIIAVAPPMAANAASKDDLHVSGVSGPAQIFGLDSSGTCNPANLTPATGRCSLAFFQSDTFSGDMQGQQFNTGGLSLLLANFSGDGVSLATYTGTVQGCPGKGTALLRYVVKLGVDTPGHNIATVRIVPGSGTGGLAALNGSGQVDAHVGLNGGTSTLAASFSCDPD